MIDRLAGIDLNDAAAGAALAQELLAEVVRLTAELEQAHILVDKLRWADSEELAQALAELAEVKKLAAGAKPVLTAAAVRAQVLRDLRVHGSGSAGWYDRNRESDWALQAAVDEWLANTTPRENAPSAAEPDPCICSYTLHPYGSDCTCHCHGEEVRDAA